MTFVAKDPIRSRRITVDEFDRLGEAGALGDGRLELIEGEIVEMAPQREPHAHAIILATETLRDAFGKGFMLRCQLPFLLRGETEVEPDVAIVAGSLRERGSLEHPSSALLIVEVSESTLTYDRTRKAKHYAGAGIPDYWIVNLVERVVEVRRDPAGETFRSLQVLRPGDTVSPLAAPHASLAVVDFLP